MHDKMISSEQAAAAPVSPNVKRLAVSLFVGFSLIYLAFLPPGIYSIDGNSMLNVAESIVTSHDLTVAPALGIPGRGGRIYSSWYPLQSLLAVPLVTLAGPISRAFHVPPHFVAAAFVGVLPVFFTAATVAWVALIGLQLGSSLHGAMRAAICFAFGTIALVYVRTFYAEPLLMFFTAAALYFVLSQTRRTILIASLCALLAVLAKPTGILVGPTLSAYLFAMRNLPLRYRLAPGFGAGLGLLLYFVYNWARFANPLTFGQPYAFSFAAIPIGIVGLLLSPGRGLIWYCPPAILAVFGIRKAFKTKQWESLCVVTLFLGFLGLHSFWTAWPGGWSWGPRFLLPVLPGLMASTALLERSLRRTLLALTSAGFLISAPTLAIYYDRYYAEANEQGISEQALLWSLYRSPIIHLWPAAQRTLADAAKNDVRELFTHTGAPSRTISESRALRVVAIWWWILPIIHVPRALGGVLSLLMVTGGAWIILWARLRLDTPTPKGSSPPAQNT